MSAYFRARESFGKFCSFVSRRQFLIEFFFVFQRSSGIDGCDLMCCNRGYATKRERRTERCKCKFHWCCFVECEECYREVEVSTCN